MNHLSYHDVMPIIKLAVDEDIATGDVTSRAVFSQEQAGGRLVAKESGTVCGLDVVEYVYRYLSTDVTVVWHVSDGDAVKAGADIASIHGPARVLLEGERIMLNFLQRMSGIATRTREVVALLAGSSIKLLDTRKTLPGHRLLDKYAVACGGGTNHRMGLYDMVMIKDTHIAAAGGIAPAVGRVRKKYGKTYRVEVEALTLDDVREALSAGADIIMLDNMSVELMGQCLDQISGQAEVEVSGNVTPERIRQLRDLSVDYISMGALTHTVRALDISFKISQDI